MNTLREQAYVNASRARDEQARLHNEELSKFMRGERERTPTQAERDAAAHADYERRQRSAEIAARYPAADVQALRDASELDRARALLDADERARSNPFLNGSWLAANGPAVVRARELVQRSAAPAPPSTPPSSATTRAPTSTAGPTPANRPAQPDEPLVLRQLARLDKLNPYAAATFAQKHRAEIRAARRTMETTR